MKTATTRLGSDIHIPTDARSKREVLDPLEDIEKWDGNVSSKDADKDIFETIHLLLNKLSPTPAEDKVHVIQFFSERARRKLRKLVRSNATGCCSMMRLTSMPVKTDRLSSAY